MRRLRMTQPRLTALHLLIERDCYAQTWSVIGEKHDGPQPSLTEPDRTGERFGGGGALEGPSGERHAATVDVASELKARCSPNNLRKLAPETIPPWLRERGDAQ